MTASARTLSIEETLLEPRALPPPPTRHALLVILIALAALLHVVTVGTGDLYSETEGQYAGAAREMVASHNWLLPTNNGIPRLQKPPLLYWVIIASYKILGVNEAAARLPVALAVVATVALIFLIGEKLSDYWRGFIAGLIYLSFCGTFLLAGLDLEDSRLGSNGHAAVGQRMLEHVEPEGYSGAIFLVERWGGFGHRAKHDSAGRYQLNTVACHRRLEHSSDRIRTLTRIGRDRRAQLDEQPAARGHLVILVRSASPYIRIAFLHSGRLALRGGAITNERQSRRIRLGDAGGNRQREKQNSTTGQVRVQGAGLYEHPVQLRYRHWQLRTLTVDRRNAWTSGSRRLPGKASGRFDARSVKSVIAKSTFPDVAERDGPRSLALEAGEKCQGVSRDDRILVRPQRSGGASSSARWR